MVDEKKLDEVLAVIKEAHPPCKICEELQKNPPDKPCFICPCCGEIFIRGLG